MLVFLLMFRMINARTMKIAQPYIFIDFEASSLSADSYPIELAWADPSQATASLQSFIIRPQQEWLDWSPDSQAIHGMSRSYIQQYGESAARVYEQFERSVAGCQICSDAPAWDQHWLDRLASVIPIKAPPVQHINDVLIKMMPTRASEWEGLLEEARQYAHMLCPATHRAAQDVSYLCKQFEFIARL